MVTLAGRGSVWPNQMASTGSPRCLSLSERCFSPTRRCDSTSTSSLKVGAAKISDLRKDAGSMKYSQPLVWPNKNNLDDPNSTTAGYMLIKSEGGFMQRTWSTDFDLFNIQMYDYMLDGENMKHAAKGDWPIMSPNIYT